MLELFIVLLGGEGDVPKAPVAAFVPANYLKLAADLRDFHDAEIGKACVKTSRHFWYLSEPLEPDREKLEKAINGGQLEEVVQQAENELSLARKMLDWKPWEPLVQEPPQGQWKWPM
ncbi:NADH dehydrogenase [ubiquinone] 1 alpha subcomplex subunit 5 [Chionoecetes opilio]|uniref:NADH dehydrogenase [ubiquinone] 1 alpha subcomplex subunit 5 n=1 Tax=Chionoecetes opilio TaxID=41210 RepID=A0A8J5CTB4_CHIOP|nr:NADH dehydrogenase [ubiquinone] 1 alpha subcomplex subunit 5 [Chionoecetes opilio]